MASGDVKVSIRKLAEMLPDSARQVILERMAIAGVGIIQRRTESGIDVDGRRFKPYSKDYARLRAASGRGTNVSLHLSGNMLGGMKVVRLNPREAVIGFEGSATAYQFKRLRTRKGTATSRKKQSGRVTHTLRRSAGAVVANAIKAKAHNDGTDTLPRRHFFDLSPKNRAELVRVGTDAVRLVK